MEKKEINIKVEYVELEGTEMENIVIFINGKEIFKFPNQGEIEDLLGTILFLINIKSNLKSKTSDKTLIQRIYNSSYNPIIPEEGNNINIQKRKDFNVKFKDYYWECGDGCCTEYGLITQINDFILEGTDDIEDLICEKVINTFLNDTINGNDNIKYSYNYEW